MQIVYNSKCIKIILLIKVSSQSKTNLTEKLEKRIKYENESAKSNLRSPFV